MAGGVDEEAALAAEQVLEAAPLRVELDAADDASQQPLVTNMGWSGSDAGHDDVADEVVGDVDPAAGRPAP